MRTTDIAYIRGLVAEGLDDDEIADLLAEGKAAAEEEEALYGRPDDQYSHGRTRWECDETYAKNDAGEWLAFM
jgi:hypothetical protein